MCEPLLSLSMLGLCLCWEEQKHGGKGRNPYLRDRGPVDPEVSGTRVRLLRVEDLLYRDRPQRVVIVRLHPQQNNHRSANEPTAGRKTSKWLKQHYLLATLLLAPLLAPVHKPARVAA